MRGGDERTGELFSYVDLETAGSVGSSAAADPGDRERSAGGAGAGLAALYAPIGRPSVPPEKLLRALVLQAFYSIRSERQLMERLEYDLLFRWFVGIGVDDAVWDHSSFSTNRDRLLEGGYRSEVPVGDAGAAAGEAAVVDAITSRSMGH